MTSAVAILTLAAAAAAPAPLVPFGAAAAGAYPGCPGERAVDRGECLLASGRAAEARRAFDVAARTGAAGERDHATLRLGDLAAAGGDTAGAMALWWRVSGPPWRRLAQARRCDHDAAACAARADDDALPPALAMDLALREARRRAAAGDAVGAAARLAGEWHPGGGCTFAAETCLSILDQALRSAPPADALAAFATALGGGDRALASARAGRAAELAAAAGAPVYAAALLSATADVAPRAELPGRLLRAAELYAAAGQAARAEVVIEFARSRLGAAALREPPWRAVRASIARAARAAALPSSPLPAPELALADAALARARALPGDPP
jgi:hypothetical protein